MHINTENDACDEEISIKRIYVVLPEGNVFIII